MPNFTRRDFLRTTPLGVAGVVLGSRRAGATSVPLSPCVGRLTAQQLLPERLTPLTLQRLAAAAVEAARQAGASYADVRVAEQQGLGVHPMQEPFGNISLLPKFMYGIRVNVDGAWAFLHGSTPTLDAVATSAKNAVATARSYRGHYGGHLAFSAMPAVHDAYVFPVQIDPFTVPLYDQADVLWALAKSAQARTSTMRVDFNWTRETRVFASSEGAMLTQTFQRSEPAVTVYATRTAYTGTCSRDVLLPSSAGFECVLAPTLPETIKAAAEELAVLAALPRGQLDVGRYPLVLDGTSFGATLMPTLASAFTLDRVMGDDAGAVGTSYLAPPDAWLGKPVASDLLNVTGNREFPHITAIKWDDDGVATRAFPLIQGGRLSTYCTSRRSLATLAGQNPSFASSMALTGCAAAPNADQAVRSALPHLSVDPASRSTTLVDLYKDMAHGVLVQQNIEEWQTDAQLATGFKAFRESGNLYEIVRGKIVRRLQGNALQFNTNRFWQSLIALGDASTVQPSVQKIYDGQPLALLFQSASAPAGAFKSADLISTARFA